MSINAQARATALEVLREVLTEENTDAFATMLNRRIKRKLPRWLRWLPIRRILDALLPDVLLRFFEDILA